MRAARVSDVSVRPLQRALHQWPAPASTIKPPQRRRERVGVGPVAQARRESSARSARRP